MHCVKQDGDAALVQRVLAGDAEAYAGLVERYRGRLGRYALRMLGNAADAEEAVQDAFVRGYRSLDRCTDAGRFGPWLFGILVNRCRTLGGQRARRRGTVFEDEASVLRASVAHPEEQAALRDAIDHALARLGAEQREAFLLKHVEQLSYEEITELTGVGTSALKMRVARAREELQRLLAEDIGD